MLVALMKAAPRPERKDGTLSDRDDIMIMAEIRDVFGDNGDLDHDDAIKAVAHAL